MLYVGLFVQTLTAQLVSEQGWRSVIHQANDMNRISAGCRYPPLRLQLFLLAVRSRSPSNRPFFVVKRILLLHIDCQEDVDTTTPSKLLFRRLETVSPSNSQTEASLYETLLQKVKERKHAHENRKEPRDARAKSKAHDKQKQDQLLAAAKIQHEAVAKRARFEQVWRSRRDGAKASAEGADSDPMRELFQLYDVVRIDEESAETIEKREKAKRDAELAQAALLANYLPLLRDCMPEAAADIEKDLSSRNLLVETDDYVYDVYAMDEGFSDRESEDEEFYPTIQIVETEGLEWGEPAESDYDSEDSNDENNPLNDYPDEDDFGDFEDQKSDKDSDETDFDIVGSDSGSDYDTVAIDNEQELRWGRRL